LEPLPAVPPAVASLDFAVALLEEVEQAAVMPAEDAVSVCWIWEDTPGYLPGVTSRFRGR
jgi:hypothetical protein